MTTEFAPGLLLIIGRLMASMLATVFYLITKVPEEEKHLLPKKSYLQCVKLNLENKKNFF